MHLERGQKVKLSDLTAATRLALHVEIKAPGLRLDLSCFGVDAAGKLSDDRYFIFYNQPSSPEGAIAAQGGLGEGRESFQVDIARLPATIRRLVITAAVDGAGAMNQVAGGSFALQEGGRELARFDFAGADFQAERAIIIAEVYFKDLWRLAAVGQGFNGGLSALLKHFGGEELPDTAEPAPAPVPVSPPPATVSLTKVTLEKPGQTHKISLTKDGGSGREIIVRARWFDNGDGVDGNDDLDLRIGVLSPRGKFLYVHADFLGSLRELPYVQHMGDVKEPGEEICKVRPDISRLVGGRVALVFSVYSAVQNGAVSVASLRPQMRIEHGRNVIDCVYDFTKIVRKQDEDTVYTYVIGTAIFDGDDVTIEPSGKTSLPSSESTPLLRWSKSGGGVDLTVDGPPIFKED